MRILIVDDEVIGRKYLANYIKHQLGHEVADCGTASEALELFQREPFPMVLSDIKMPGTTGVELLQKLKSLPEGRLTDVVLVTGYGDMSTAIQALRHKAYDYLLKPIKLEELEAVVSHVAERQSLLRENRELAFNFENKVAEATRETRKRLESIQKAYAEVVGIGRIGIFSDSMRTVFSMAERFHQDRTVPVLIEGETGTGKEIVARLVHFGKGEVTTPFVSVNCSALTPTLFESELFGYEGGAFSGSKKTGQKGKLELAHGGTLFLDEIGDMPLDLQPKLLRVLEEREFYRVGGVIKVRIDVRIICATNRDLESMVENRTFRRDLFYRLNLGRIVIPPLRRRKEAIGPLALMFLNSFAEQKRKRLRGIDPQALDILKDHSWPGNVRELENAIERVALLYDDTEIRPEHLSFLNSREESQALLDPQGSLLQPGSLVLPEEALDLKAIEAEIVRKTLKKFDENKSQAARYLGLSRGEFYTRLKNAF